MLPALAAKSALPAEKLINVQLVTNTLHLWKSTLVAFKPIPDYGNFFTRFIVEFFGQAKSLFYHSFKTVATLATYFVLRFAK